MIPLRDLLNRFLPSWLSDSSPVGDANAYRTLYTLVRFVDSGVATMMLGSIAAVGRGGTDALGYVGDARGVIRGRFDTDDSYRAKLTSWIDRWKEAGNARRLAREIWEYLGDGPRVRIVTRAGHWVTIASDGTLSETDAPWDWDSISNPERNDPAAPWWSDMWIIIYPAYAVRPGHWGDLHGADGYGIGQLCPRAEVDAIKLIINRYKACHSCVRAVIWTSDATRFDPAVSGSKPNGKWGQWGFLDGGNHYVASDRDLTTCRYWEPR